MREHSNALQNLAMPEEASINVYNEPPVVPLAVDAHEVENKSHNEDLFPTAIFHRFRAKSNRNSNYSKKNVLGWQIPSGDTGVQSA